MQRTSNSGLNPADLVRVLFEHVRLWAVPAVVCTIAAAGYALFAPRDWRATQSLIVRAEAAGVTAAQIGKFSDLSEMKTLQETILELAKSQSVLQTTLRMVGPPSSYSRPAQWPTAQDTEDFREAIDMRPPGGAEFGKTEVFYLSVLDTDRQRAAKLVATLCEQLESRMQQLRDERARGMIVELHRSVELAEAELTERTARLSKFEAAIGADLAELRNLNAMVGSQGEVSQELQAIEAERRANEALRRENSRLLVLLQAAEKDPQQLLATPSSLLRSQPAVSRLKNALVDAQVRAANLLGSRSESHPYVVAARESEELIRGQLHAEIAIAIKGIELDLQLNADRETSLHGKWSAARARLTRLAESRAEYANLVSSVENHTKLVESARKNLSDARSRQAGAVSASVIARIDGVDSGVRPVGPGRTTVTAAGGVGGLLLGLGLVFLVANPATFTGGGAAGGEQVDRGSVGSAVPSTSNRNGQAAAGAVTGASRWNASTEDHAGGRPDGRAAGRNTGSFGLFNGMTLDEAIRSVERRPPASGGR